MDSRVFEYLSKVKPTTEETKKQWINALNIVIHCDEPKARRLIQVISDTSNSLLNEAAAPPPTFAPMSTAEIFGSSMFGPGPTASYNQDPANRVEDLSRAFETEAKPPIHLQNSIIQRAGELV